MSIKKYRKKAVVIEAIQFHCNGNSFEECDDFMDGELLVEYGIASVKTLEGNMKVSDGDYIIKGVGGEFYPCKPDIFAKTFEPVPKETKHISFLKELKNLLIKYDVDITANDEWQGYAECGQDIQMEIDNLDFYTDFKFGSSLNKDSIGECIEYLENKNEI